MPQDPNLGFTTGAPYQTGTPSTQTSGGSTSSTSASGPGSAYYWLQLALQGASSYYNINSAQQANRTNVNLQKEQLDWEERMANTAVQRRANDIEAAGGNRALAFTNGSEASTPTVAPAHVDAPQLGSINLMSAKLMQQQLANIEADTRVKNATAQKTQVEADIASGSSATELDAKNVRNIEDQQWSKIKTQIMQNTQVNSAAEARKASNTVDTMIQLLKQQAAKGEINLEALKAIDNIGGVEGNMLAPLIKLVITLIGK